MKVANTRKVNERITEYIKREQLNSLIGTGLAAPVSVDQIVFEDVEDLKNHANGLRDRMKQNGITYTEDQALIATMVMTVFDSYLGDAGKVPATVLDEVIRNGRIFHEGEIEQNPYYKNVHLDGRKSGKFEFSKADDKRYELVMYDGPKSKFKGIMIPAVGAFDYDFYYPMLKENGSVWMSITPNEIFTMERDVAKASGKVLTLGCGMGYFAYMAAIKEEVESVTIVEKQEDVIEMFNSCILPQLDCKDKIRIIHADAFDYMENLADGEYDYCFIDIWKGNTDTVPYLKMKKLCKRFRQMKTSYWIEEALTATVIGYVFMIILEEFYKNQNLSMPKTTDLPEDEEFKLNYLRNLLQDEEISKPEHVDYYMDYHNIIALMS